MIKGYMRDIEKLGYSQPGLWKFTFRNGETNETREVLQQQEADAWLEISRQWCFHKSHRITLVSKERYEQRQSS